MFLMDDIAKWMGRNKETNGNVLATQGSQIAASLPFPLLICTNQLVITGANQAFCSHFKHSANDLDGAKLTDIFGPGVSVWSDKNRPCKLASLLKMADQKNPKKLSGDFPNIGARTIELFTRRLPSSSKKGLLLLFHDVSDAVDLKGKIEKSRNELLAVYDGQDDPVVMIDDNFKIRRINRAMLESLGGGSYNSFIGKPCYLKLHGLSKRCPGCTADETFATKEKTARWGLLQARPRTDDYSYEITCHPLVDEKNKVMAIAESYRDITEVLRIEEELYESERSRVMKPLAAGVAHEIRNPLAVIRAEAQYGIQEADTAFELREILKRIIKSAESANNVVSDLLDFAQPQDVKLKLQALKPVLERAISLIKAPAAAQKVRISRSLSTKLPKLVIDDKRFIHSISQFLTNALEAMPRGGKLSIVATSNKTKENVTISIKDTGNGVPEEVVSNLFHPFYSTKKDGVGLGLPIAEGIIRSHGGRVHFSSWPGKGTEVSISLPLRKKSAQPSQIPL